jgi:L-malate glycosyltransferase
MNQGSDARTHKRVLIVVKGLGLGGVERLLSRSVPNLDRIRYHYEVCYFTPWKDDVVDSFESQGIKVHCLNVSSELSPRAFRRLARLIEEGSFDLVHTHSPYPSVLTRLVSLRKKGLKIVHTEHSLPGSRRLLTRIANRATYRLCDLVISISADVDRAINSDRWLGPPATEIIRGGVAGTDLTPADLSTKAALRAELGIPEEHHVIGNVAHLRKQKGHTLFLQVARTVAERRPDTTFVLVGREKEPGFEDELRSMARRLGLEDRVIFAGFVPDPYPLLSTFDVFLMTSQHEGFPVALIEAMALGVPAVATDVGGVAEAITHGDEGLLAPFGDSDMLAAHVIGLLEDDSERYRLASNARRRVEDEFTVEQMVRRVEGTYQALLANIT